MDGLESNFRSLTRRFGASKVGNPVGSGRQFDFKLKSVSEMAPFTEHRLELDSLKAQSLFSFGIAGISNCLMYDRKFYGTIRPVYQGCIHEGDRCVSSTPTFRVISCLTMVLFAVIVSLAPRSSALAAPMSQEEPAVLVGAGDISECYNENDTYTAYLMDSIEGTVVALGDTVYEVGSLKEYYECYDPTWGRHKDRRAPCPATTSTAPRVRRAISLTLATRPRPWSRVVDA